MKVRRFRYHQIHMGVRVSITCWHDDQSVVEDACQKAFARFAELDEIMSDYLPTSELRRLEANPHGQPVEVSEDLFRVLERAQEIAELSNGAFDATCGPLSRLWRKARESGVMPNEGDISRAASNSGWRALKLECHKGARENALGIPPLTRLPGHDSTSRLDHCLTALAAASLCSNALQKPLLHRQTWTFRLEPWPPPWAPKVLVTRTQRRDPTYASPLVGEAGERTNLIPLIIPQNVREPGEGAGRSTAHGPSARLGIVRPSSMPGTPTAHRHLVKAQELESIQQNHYLFPPEAASLYSQPSGAPYLAAKSTLIDQNHYPLLRGRLLSPAERSEGNERSESGVDSPVRVTCRTLQISHQGDSGRGDSGQQPAKRRFKKHSARRLNLPRTIQARLLTTANPTPISPIAPTRTVTFEKPGMGLDLGGIGKGYACDEALAVLTRQGISSALVEAGGDIAMSDPPPNTDGWRVGAQSGLIVASNCGISTSGPSEQFLEVEIVTYSHVLDPRTGLGLTAGEHVTVLAPNAFTADPLGKVVSIMGPTESDPILRRFHAEACG